MYSAEDRAELSRRTRIGLEKAKAGGVRLGRPSKVAPQVLNRIKMLREMGSTLQTIAHDLNALQEPTATGKRWTTSSVQSALKTIELDTVAGDILKRRSSVRTR